MSWALLIVGILGVIHAANAMAPRKKPRLVFAWSFFASWLTIELVWHNLVIGAVITALLVNAGALDQPIGVVGLVLVVMAEAMLVVIGLVTRRTVVTVRGALEELDPEHAGAPRFPRSHVVLPFLMGRRPGVTKVKDVEFARASGKVQRLDVIVPSAPIPAGRAKRPALLQIHGGGWVIGKKGQQGIPLLRHMAKQGWVGFDIDYRLSPAATFPDHLVDCKKAVAWIREHADEYDVDPDFICVTGGSAGGHLAALVGTTVNDPRFQPGFEDANTSVAAAVPFYGAYDFTPNGAFMADPETLRRFFEPIVMKAFAAEEPQRFEEASPLHHVHSGVPPFFVVHGDRDTLCPVEDARVFVERMREESAEPVLYAEMQGAQHAFEVFPSVRTARVIEGVERFLSTVWARRDEPTPAVEAQLEDALTD